MSRKSDVEKLLEALGDIQESQITHKKDKSDPPDNSQQIKVAIISVALASILPICGIIYQMGSQKQELFEGIEKVGLETETKFIRAFADHKDYINKDFRDLQSEVKEVVRENHQLKLMNSQLEKRIDELEDENKDLKRASDDQYRTVQYLKSQHSLNIPLN